ncbi:hypothetical protein GYMLUDRAFT_91909 [Collybiopsis luxurians FD-317 M1]|nr:hypothetical protein GYMLUDRAFT_91909 [Collybiopsis luxurians FD-317 M1]
MARKQKQLRNVPQFPDELVSLIFSTCPSSARAVLLRCSKHFNEIGLQSLYRSIWISTATTIELLSATLAKKPVYADLIRCLEIIIVAQTTSSMDAPRKSLKIVLSSLKKVEKLQLYAPTLLSKYDFPHSLTSSTWIPDVSLPNCLTSYTLAIHRSHLPHLGQHLDQLTSLEHLCIQVSEQHIYDQSFKVTLPNLTSYHGPPIFMQSLAQHSKKLSTLVLEVFTFDSTFILTGGAPDPTPLENELRYLKAIGSKDDDQNTSTLSFLQIIFDAPRIANHMTQFLPNVEHLSLLCTDGNWITADTSDPWNGRVRLEFLSQTPSMSKFALSFIHTLPNVPWDLAVIAESLGKTCSNLVEVDIYGARFRKLTVASENASWSHIRD